MNWPDAGMCSEAVWWTCHRALIADYLKSVGVTVLYVIFKAAVPVVSMLS